MAGKVLLKSKDFKDKKVDLKSIHLDPNNPRFSIESDAIVPDNKIMEEHIHSY